MLPKIIFLYLILRNPILVNHFTLFKDPTLVNDFNPVKDPILVISPFDVFNALNTNYNTSMDHDVLLGYHPYQQTIFQKIIALTFSHRPHVDRSLRWSFFIVVWVFTISTSSPSPMIAFLDFLVSYLDFLIHYQTHLVTLQKALHAAPSPLQNLPITSFLITP